LANLILNVSAIDVSEKALATAKKMHNNFKRCFINQNILQTEDLTTI
jgi:2-polyprenyl-3-methyl-5-hydroxy-6-metoxy-1,4-benzoquinol methylase